MSIIAQASVDVFKRIDAAEDSGRVLTPRRHQESAPVHWRPGMPERRRVLRRDNRPVVNDIIAVEFMESARLANPLWSWSFEDIQGLTARR